MSNLSFVSLMGDYKKLLLSFFSNPLVKYSILFLISSSTLGTSYYSLYKVWTDSTSLEEKFQQVSVLLDGKMSEIQKVLTVAESKESIKPAVSTLNDKFIFDGVLTSLSNITPIGVINLVVICSGVVFCYSIFKNSELFFNKIFSWIPFIGGEDPVVRKIMSSQEKLWALKIEGLREDLKQIQSKQDSDLLMPMIDKVDRLLDRSAVLGSSFDVNGSNHSIIHLLDHTIKTLDGQGQILVKLAENSNELTPIIIKSAMMTASTYWFAMEIAKMVCNQNSSPTETGSAEDGADLEEKKESELQIQSINSGSGLEQLRNPNSIIFDKNESPIVYEELTPGGF